LLLVLRQCSNTVSGDDDEEWGWDDEQPKQQLEMPRVGENRSLRNGSNPRQRGVSPQFGNGSNAPRSGGAPMVQPPINNVISPKTERKGFAVRKTGMNNPLHSSPPPAPYVQQQQQYSVGVTNASMAAIPPSKIIPPSTDDFFAEMGIAPKPKFPTTTATTTKPSLSTTTSKRLGATVLPLDNDDLIFGGDNGGITNDTWGNDDADLDDLLDN
jgi:hypothetical protein